MKFLKLIFVFCCLMIMSMNTWSQTASPIDLSTGIDNSGNPQPPMADDPRWTVKTPNGQYRALKIGTGVAYSPLFSSNRTPDYTTISNKAWLVPFPWTQAELAQPQNASPYPWIFTPQEGDMKFTAETGTYIYRLQFTLNWPACQRPNSATIRVRTLTGLEKVEDVLLNGYSAVDVDNYAISYCPNGKIGQRADDMMDYNYLQSISQVFPSYTIPLTANHLLNGTNYLYVRVSNTLTTNIGAGFTCDAELHFTYGPNSATTPGYTVSGTNTLLCNGVIPVMSINMWNLPNVGATAQITASPSVPGFPVTASVSQYTPAQLNLDPNTPATYTVTLTSNDQTLPCASVKTLKTFSCNVSPFNFNPNNWNQRVFTGSGDPVDPHEAEIPGFETKWKLEELDDDGEPVYTITDPEAWRTAAGESGKFYGFTAENDYHGEVGELTGSPDNEGTFSADRVYRITRAYRSDNYPDWQEYSVTIGPGYEEMTPPEEEEEEGITTGVKMQQHASHTDVSVYPNPGHDLFTIRLAEPEKAGRMVLYNAVGKSVETIAYAPGRSSYALNLSGYAKGIYFLSIPEKNVVQKIIVE